jgi:hypothetical protein
LRFARCVLVAGFLVGAASAEAGDCVPGGPAAQLDSETVDWTIIIASGRSCLRGLRSGAMIIDRVGLSAPAQVGEASIHGYGFSYSAPRGYKGEDSFSVSMSGTNRGIRGNSVIRVHVSVQ